VITSQRTDSNRRAFQTLRDQAFDTLSLAGPVSKESRSLKAAYEIVREAFEPSSATQWEAQARASLDRCAKDTLTPLNELRLGVMLPEAIITWAAKYEKEAAKGWLGRAIHGWRKAAKEGDPETKSKAVAKLAEYLCKGGPGLVTVPLAGYRRLFLQAEAGSRHAALAMVRLHSKSAARAGEYNAELCEAWMRIATALTPHDDGPQFEPAVELGDTWALVRAHERRRASGH
jgi:hypothetical protein